MSQRGSRSLAVALAIACVAVAAIAGVVLLTSTAPSHTQPGVEPPAALAAPSTVPGTQPPSAKPSATTTFTPVKGPNGITTVVPRGWPLKPCPIADCQEVDDPVTPTRFLRLGATAARGGRPFDEQLAYEQEFSAGRANFQRVKLDAVSQHGFDGADWEFEYDLNGVRRHVKTLLWRANGMDNWVYASAELAAWPDTRAIFDKMAASAVP
ncbi:hypothetical protein [Actinocrispum wychmicini]|uniref:Serine/threonine protein kinase n=1 Tax=Actinocrispum wychmicini TaxID=1213861 RepID=A0A4R2JEF8_9PSEU|nr:hypothetical protein [Actinocrispum wychmicini]TCO57374.1 hypothetical protein EV192_106851 [Actinocrispum wychmicini]